MTDDRGRIWIIVADSSLSDVPPDFRAEVVTPILEYSDIPGIPERDPFGEMLRQSSERNLRLSLSTSQVSISPVELLQTL